MLKIGYFYFKSPISSSRGLFELFSPDDLNFHHEKNQPRLRPLQPFLNIDHDFDDICFLKKTRKKLVQNFGHNNPEKCKKIVWLFMCILMTTFLDFTNPIGPLAL